MGSPFSRSLLAKGEVGEIAGGKGANRAGVYGFL